MFGCVYVCVCVCQFHDHAQKTKSSINRILIMKTRKLPTEKCETEVSSWVKAGFDSQKYQKKPHGSHWPIHLLYPTGITFSGFYQRDNFTNLQTPILQIYRRQFVSVRNNSKRIHKVTKSLSVNRMGHRYSI